LRDLGVAYRARRDGQAPGFAPLPVQYADYALWQAAVLGDEQEEGSALSRQLGFWRERLSGLADQLDLPLDHGRPAVAITQLRDRLGVCAQRINLLVQRQRAPPFATIEAGVPVLGASSLGALRAAELDAYGMRGVGRVFEAFADGTLTADDEVAAAHGPQETGFIALSVALVNVRATVASALLPRLVRG